MELTVMERLMLLESLIKEGDILFLRLRHDLTQKLALTEKELKKFGVTQNAAGLTTWKPDIPQETKIELTKAEEEMIKDSLKKLNREHKLTPNHVSLYEKFVKE